jgi:hypothetical protein
MLKVWQLSLKIVLVVMVHLPNYQFEIHLIHQTMFQHIFTLEHDNPLLNSISHGYFADFRATPSSKLHLNSFPNE